VDLLDGVSVLLCDADDCLFGSERPAFAASADVTNQFLAAHGVEEDFAAEELRQLAAGRNFRANAAELGRRFGFSIEEADLDRWVALEREQVSAQLGSVLRPDPEVIQPLTELASRFTLAVVSSSALARLEVCFTASGLDDLFPRERRFSAEDSLPRPTSKPDPAVYAFAGRALGVSGTAAVAIEDSVSGVRSAVAAGFPVIGNLLFVAAEERPGRAIALREAGAAALIGSWRDLT
jgi:beta-phosphoglucomutase-like phosphatase (HAD superfamily)